MGWATAFVAVALATGSAPNAFAQQHEDASVWTLDARLRYEAVSQEGLADADALTLRTRLGFQTPSFNRFTGLIELEAVADLGGDYNDTINGRTAFAIVPDPESFEWNRLQLGWRGEEERSAVLGRQRIILGNARFVGNAGFRQNEQTFDAVRLGGRLSDHARWSYIYLDRVLRVFGSESPQGEWDSDSHVVSFEADAQFGHVAAYGLLLDFQSAATQSSQTYGVRWSHEWTQHALKPRLVLEAAQQSDYRGNTAPFELGYHLVEASARGGPAAVTLGWEQLEGDGTRGFATPLATLHAFQGSADVFLNTPPDGVRDLYAGVAITTAPWPAEQPVTFTLMAHEFGADNGRTDFGEELDVSARFMLNEHVAIEFKAASFDGDDVRFQDRTKMWASVEFR